MKIGLIGCGKWGQNYARCLSELGVLAGICASSTVSSQNHASRHKTHAMTLTDMLANPMIKGLVIASPSHLHADQTRQGLLAGKAILCEKPAATSSHSARELMSLAEQKQLIYLPAHILHYHAAYAGLLEAIKAAKIGKIRRITATRLGPRAAMRANEHPIWSLGLHDISIILELLGDYPSSIRLDQDISLQKDRPAKLSLTFPNQAKAFIETGWVGDTKVRQMIVNGETGTLTLDDVRPWAQKLSYMSCQTKTPSFLPITEDEPLKTQCLDFMESIKTSTPPRLSSRHALNVTKVLETLIPIL